MSCNMVTSRMLLPWGLMTPILPSGQQQPGPRATPRVASQSAVSRDVTVRRDEGTIPQRAEESVPVSLSPPMTAEQADLARRFRELMLPHLDAAYNLARHLLRDPVAAEDVAQDAFLRAFRAFEGYRGGDPKAWILAIVRNCFLTFAARRRADPTVPFEVSHLEREAPNELVDLWDAAQETPEAALLRKSEAASLRELLEALPGPFREVLVLREFDELSYREIAEVTAVPIGTVMSRLARAREMLSAA